MNQPFPFIKIYPIQYQGIKPGQLRRFYVENEALCGCCNGSRLQGYMDYCRACGGTGIEDFTEFMRCNRGNTDHITLSIRYSQSLKALQK